MLEYQFNEIRLRNNFYIVESDTSPGANCVICYDFKPEKTAFFSELDLWFTCDNKSLSENDYKKLAAFYDDNPVFNGRCNRYKLCADINFYDFDFSDSNRDVSSPVVRDELLSSMGISSVAQIAVPAADSGDRDKCKKCVFIPVPIVRNIWVKVVVGIGF